VVTVIVAGLLEGGLRTVKDRTKKKELTTELDTGLNMNELVPVDSSVGGSRLL
jgi:hypothetical protein